MGAGALLCVWVGVSACQPTEEPPAPRSVSPAVPAPAVSPAFDVGAVMRRAGLAFRADKGTFTASQDTWRVRVEPDGTARFEPLHWREVPPTGAARMSGERAKPASTQAVTAGAPLRVRTASVARGGRPLLEGLAASVREDGALALARGPVVEVLRSGEEGVEQRWELESPPEGAGDLEVRVALAGLEYAGQTEHGHHFRDPVTGLGVRYGRATWVDAAGVRTAVETVREGGELVLRVPEAVLARASWPAVLDPVISPELGLDAPVPQPASDTDTLPSVAYGGGVYLVAWMHYGSFNGYDILAARVRASDGALLDVGGIALSLASGDQWYPAVASSGSEFLVAWTGGPGLVGARVRASDGQVLDGTPRPLASSPAVPTEARVSFDGTNYFVVWSDGRAGASDIYGTRVRASDGVALDGSGIPICVQPFNQGSPAVAFDGTRYLVAWEDMRGNVDYDIYGARVRASDAAVLDANGFAISTTARIQWSPAVTFDGTQFLVAWDDARNHVESSTFDVYGARVRGADGAVLDTAGIPIATGVASQGAVAVASRGAGSLVVWQRREGSSVYDIHGARVGSDGTVTQAQAFGPAATAADQERVAVVATDGNDFLVVWEEQGSGLTDIHSARMRGSDGTALDVVGRLVSTDANIQDAPSVARAGDTYFVAWKDQRTRSNGWDIYGARVRASDGGGLDDTATPLGTTSHSEEFPRVASDGRDFLVVWSTYNWNIGAYDVFGIRVRGSDGRAMEGAPFVISTSSGNQQVSAVAYGEGYYLVTWTDDRNSGTNDIYAARVRALDGRVMEPGGFAVSRAARAQSDADVAYGAGSFLVAWTDGRVDTTSAGSELYGARVRASDGVLLDDVTTGRPLSTAAGNQLAATVAFDGGQFLVAWTDVRNGHTDIYGTRVRASDGVALDAAGLVLVTGAGNQVASALTFDGRHHLLVWQEFLGEAYQLRGSRLTPAGVVLDGTGFEVGRATNSAISVASWGPGRSVVVYPGKGSGRQARVKLRLVSDASNGSLCTGGAQCDSGFCADGVCCNSACGGGVAEDCQACSVAAGGTVDGTCGPISASAARVCRTQVSACDVAERCDGAGLECPADVLAPAGTECRPSTTACDVAEACTGDSAECPEDRVRAAGVECRARAGDCDVAEACDGSSRLCQEDGFAAGGECRPSAHACDAAETCSGQSSACPPDAAAADGTACDDGSACTQTDACRSGTCTGAEPVVCAAPNPCMRAGVCDPASGVCSPPQPVADGTSCDDGNACTQTDTCQAGACTGASPVVCAAGDACHVAGTCNPATGACSAPTPAPDGTACSDGNACTQTDTCQSGACTGASPVMCTAGGACQVAGTCDPATGACSAPTPAPDGTACDDGNACTQTDACQSGACAGATPVVCEAPNPCMRAGVCDPASGVCSPPQPVADGTACDDGNACTQSDSCQAGACAGANPVVCTGGDACQVAGTCNPATGACSAPVPAVDGTACSDGNACTRSDSCQSGTCTGTDPVVCTAGDACHVAGTCNPSTGACSNPTAEDGTMCSGGACQSGECIPTPDAGSGDTDAGTDAGSEPDAGQTPDAGDASDAGTRPPRPLPPHDAVGCGCGVPTGPANMGLLLLIAGAALLRRSRRQRP